MMNKKYQNDLRVKRTEKLILESLIKCTTQKGFSAVTVNDITIMAEINRATFYRHYKDKYDLLNQYAKTVFEMLDSQKHNTQNPKSHSIPENLIKIFDHVSQNATFYKVMWGKNGSQEFKEKILFYIQKRIQKSLPKNQNADKKLVDLFTIYSSNASFAVVVWWLENNMPYTSEEMIKILQHLETENLKAILK